MLAKIPDIVTRQIAVILGTSGSGQSLLDVLQQFPGNDVPFELHGLFIEDDDLQRVAALPFAKELCRLTLSIRDIQHAGFDRTVALRMRTARNAIEELARRLGVAHTFRHTQGSTLRLLRDTVNSADITVFEPLRKLSVAPVRQFTPGRQTPRPVVIVLDDVLTADEILLTAAQLAEGQTTRITVILRAESKAKLQTLEHMAYELLPGRPTHLLSLPDHGIQTLIAAVLAERAGMLVIGAREELLRPRTLGLLLQHLECPICLVRQTDNISIETLN